MRLRQLTVLVIMLGWAPLAFGQTRVEPRARAATAPAELLARAGVAAQFDVPYAGDDNPRHRLDLYLPKDRKEGDKPLPVVLYVRFLNL